MNSTRLYVAVRNELAARMEELRRRSEAGLTTTEVAVLTFILVAVAVAVGAVIWNYANDQVEALPDDPTADIGN